MRAREEEPSELLRWAGKWTYWKLGFYRFSRSTAHPSNRLKPTMPEPARHSPPVCESVCKWSEKRFPGSCQILTQDHEIVLTLPNTIEPDIDSGFSGNFTIKGKYLVPLEKIRLVGKSGLMILSDGSYASEIVYNRNALERDPDYHSPIPRKVLKKRGAYFNLLGIWNSTNNYYHWLHDSMMRLYLVVDLLPNDVRFIVHPQLTTYHYESLAMFGIGSERLRYYPGDEEWQLETLYFTPHSTPMIVDSPEIASWFRDRIYQAVGVSNAKRQKRIFISRRRANYWRVTNQDEVESHLADYGFVTYVLEDLSFRDQVLLFSQAEAVVGPQGSGFANLFFAPNGTRVLDIQDPGNIRHAYWSICNVFENKYWYFFAEPVKNGTNRWPDLFVPIEKLEKTMTRLFAPQASS